jgi:predicted kinase
MTVRTYDQLRDIARTLLQAGFSVVVDATFLRQQQRELFRRLAKEQACTWFIVDVSAPQSVLVERIKWRSSEGLDASDATVEIMERQQETEESFTQEELLHVSPVDSRDPQSIISAINEIMRKTGR